MITPTALMGSFLLDLLCGDPEWFPHPVRLIGKAVEELERARLVCQIERKRLSEMLGQLGFRVFPSAANFLLMKRSGAACSASSLYERLIVEHHILVRDCGRYEGLEPEMYLRVAVKDGPANLKLIHALKEVLA